jgi:transcription initiation factor IIE alpha subunit
MKETVPIDEKDFNHLIRIKKFDEMSDDELDAYTEIFVDKIRDQFDKEDNAGFFWCPKCETRDAVVEINDSGSRAMATCAHCRMAVVVMASEI